MPANAVAISPYLTAEEACAYLRRKSMKAFYKAIVLEQIPHRRDGRHFLFKPAELDAWLEAKQKQAGEPATNHRLVVSARTR